MTRTLAVETSGAHGSLAILEDDRLVFDQELPTTQRSAQTLAPSMSTALEQAGWSASEFDLVATTIGPGSFTGLRVGVTTTKTLAYAADAQVVGLNTLQVIAAQVIGEAREVDVILDAQRQQLFHSRFLIGESVMPKAMMDVRIVDIQEFVDSLQDTSIVTGPGISRLTNVPRTVTLISEEARTPRAATVGKLAIIEAQCGNTLDCWSLVPNYYRKSAAEEKLGE